MRVLINSNGFGCFGNYSADSNSNFVVAKISFFLNDSNFWCVQSSITWNETVHVHVLWPVCTHTIPFRMMWCLRRFAISKIKIFIQKRCSLKAVKVIETATRSKNNETIVEGHNHIHVHIHVHFHVHFHFSYTYIYIYIYINIYKNILHVRVHVHERVRVRVFVFVVWCRVTSCVARRCSLCFVCRS